MNKRSVFSMKRYSGYGQYVIIKTTFSGKITKKHSTDSQAWDDFLEGKCSQARLKRLYGQ